jgi:glycosyltransferase involved in cell wall biosynthesis
MLSAHSATLFQKRALTSVISVLENKAMAKANKCITVSDGLSEEIFRIYGIRPQVIMNCHKRGKTLATPSIKSKCGLSESTFLFVVVGMFKKDTDYFKLLDAFMRIDDAHLAFVGGGYEDLYQAVQLRDQQNIHFLGIKDSREIVDFVSGGDLAITPYINSHINFDYSLPNGFFIAISAGLPVMHHDLVEIKRISESGEFTIIADFNSVQDIHEKCERILSDKLLYDQLRRGAQHSSLTWEHEEMKLVELLQNL